jgi:uncharacterized protein GlcG (DUF336 family)
MHVNLENAEKVIEAARMAITLKTQMCIAVVDSGANLKAFMRMDDAWVGSIDISIKKAKTACFFGMATGLLGQLSQPGKPLYGIEHSNDGLITFPGGLPIVDEDGANDALRSGPYHAGAFGKMVLAQGLGDEDRQAPRAEKGDCGLGASIGRDHAPHMG